jgi:N-methylhydantoinase A/oxoprolinase/acetone carboxylase beta subunit
MKSKYGLGIDAGGTYTDVAMVDFATSKVVNAGKTPTTHPDPSGGIRDALARVDADLLPQVSMVSLATTFATNAIVEDRGAKAGLILVGYDDMPPGIPRTANVLMVKGGHTVTGEEKAPLDLGAIEERLDAFIEGLDAVAVTGFFSVRNPQHELRVAQLIRDRFNLPVVRGHRLSMLLDAVKRATTAWWNARLIPLISNLIRSTTEVLSERGIQAPLMVVRGNGTLMSAHTALDRPVDTLLSGPAASILGAKHLSGLENALIVDMGGTTTDMATLAGGRVAIDPQGAQVGRWKTHVEAAKVRTIGLGGDSLISANGDQRLSVGPRRVLPLCMLAERYSNILPMLQTILRRIDKAPSRSLNPCSFYVTCEQKKNPKNPSLPEFLGAGPVSEFLLFEDPSHWSSSLNLGHYEEQGLVFRGSLTPTDIRVASGQFSLGSQEAAQLGLAIYARYIGMDESSFAEAVEEEIRKRLCMEAVTYVRDKDGEALSRLSHRWFRQARVAANGVDLDVQLKLTTPVIGVGSPAAAYLPTAFGHLHTKCIVPEAYDVSVAVGAVVGMVDITVRGKVIPTDTGHYRLYTAAGKETFGTLEESLVSGRQRLEDLARERMRRSHVAEPLIDFVVEEKRVKTGRGEEIHLETELRLRATGRPNVWEHG